jgi:hypothetical protein
VELFSNLSGTPDKWKQIIAALDNKILRINASFHPEQADIGEFVKTCDLLALSGVSLEITVVADNIFFERTKKTVDLFRAAGFSARPIRMMRAHSFAAYSDEYSAWIASFYKNQGKFGRFALNGKKCPAGKDFVRIKPSGQIWMCATANHMNDFSGWLGNIEWQGFSGLFAKEIVCPYKLCVCPPFIQNVPPPAGMQCA